MAILYVETNFVVGAARGQDPDAEALLGLSSPPLRLAMPSVCVMETLSREESLAKTHTRGPDGASRVELIALSTEVLATWIDGEIVLREPTDALILDIVLDHARLCEGETKGFLSGNKTEFA